MALRRKANIEIVSPFGARKLQLRKTQNPALGGLLEDIVSLVTPGVQAGSTAIKNQTSNLVSELISSSQFKNVLNQVHDEAEQAVTEKVKENAFMLMSLAVIGGVIGGTFFKGPVGIAVAGGLAGLGAFQILKNPTSTTKK